MSECCNDCGADAIVDGAAGFARTSRSSVVTPVPHVLQDQQPQHYLCRCLRPAPRPALGMPLPLRFIHALPEPRPLTTDPLLSSTVPTDPRSPSPVRGGFLSALECDVEIVIRRKPRSRKAARIQVTAA